MSMNRTENKCEINPQQSYSQRVNLHIVLKLIQRTV